MNALRIAHLVLAALFAAGAAQAQVITARAGTTTATATTTGIQFRAFGAVAAEASGDTNPDPTIPAGTVAGDLLICVIESRDNVAHTMPAAWTLLNTATSGAQHRASVFWKRAIAGEAAPNIGHPGGNAVIARIIRFSGVDTVTAFDVANSFTASAADTSVEAGAITTVTANSMLVMTEHIADNWTNLNLPTGNAAVTWNQAFFSATGSGNDAAIGAHYGRGAAAGLQAALVSTRTAGGANAISHGAQLALRPALFVINKPALTVQNDVMIASITVSPSTANVVAPAGWALVQRTDQAAGTSSSLLIYSKVATAVEPASYGWNIAAGTGTTASAVTGVAGSITSFFDVDTTTPVDDVSGAATASSSTHTAPAVTTTVGDTMILSFFEYGSSGTWSTPPTTAQLANVASAAVPGAGGISLGVFSNPQAAAGGSGTRDSTASGANPDTGATAMLALRPNLQNPVLQWTMDELLWNGTAGEVVDTSGNGLHGQAFNGAVTASATPAIAGNPGTCRYGAFDGANDYVEVADNALLDVTDELTVMAWIRPTAYPAAGALKSFLSKDQNYEMHLNSTGNVDWWWGGGALELFSAGTVALNTWTHVTLVYSRAGGFQRIYLNGVQDANTNNQTGALVPNAMPFQVAADQGFAGRNFAGFIDEVHVFRQALNATRVQQYMNTTRPCAAFVDHYALSHAGSGIACVDQSITITAHDASHAAVDAGAATVNLSTSNSRGTWTGILAGGGTLNDATAGDGAATYTFAVGSNSVELAFRYANLAAPSETFGFNVNDGVFSEATGTASGSDDPSFTMAQAGFQFRNVTDGGSNVPTQISGKPSDTGFNSKTLRIQAIRTDTVTGSCTGLFASQARSVDLGAECNNPLTCAARQVSVNATNIATSNDNGGAGAAAYTGVALAFSAASEADTVIIYPDAGQISLHARYDLDAAVAGFEMLGSSNAFVVRPFGFTFPGIGHSNTAAGTLIGAAGDNFSMTLQAYQWAAGEDTDNDGVPDAGSNISDNGTVPNFAATVTVAPNANLPAVALGSVARGAACASAATVALSGGTATAADWCYSEVGNVILTATSNDYLGAADADIAGNSALDGGGAGGYVGRFKPKYFAVTGAPTLANRSALACAPASTFTYMNEGLSLGFTLEARNTQNALTQNYTGTYAKLNLATAADLGIGARSGATNLTPRVDSGLAPTGSFTNGSAALVAKTAIRRATPDNPDGPYSATQFGIAPNDNDPNAAGGVKLNAFDLDVDGVGGNDHLGIGATTALRFGRLRLQNAYGSGITVLPVPIEVQYWNGSSFPVNADDNCTTLPRSAIAQTFTAPLVACDTAVNGATVSFAGGVGAMVLSAPGAGKTGSVLLTPNLGTAAGSYCDPASFVAAGSAPLSYLLGRWDDAANPDADGNTAYDDKPGARAAFGLYGSQPKNFIFFRENY